MKILAIDKILPDATSEEILNNLPEETRAVWGLYQKGFVREMYFRTEGTPGAVLILECEDIEHARMVVSTLPLVKKNLIDFDLYALGFYAPLATLFAEDKKETEE